jgi:tetratricopeptide (TPR) repeat protein
LQRLCERESETPEFAADVQHLIDHSFLIRPEERTLAFRHALVQEVAYGNELRRERRRMHESAAEAIEESHSTGPEIHPLLAHHYGEAESWPRALPHLLAAGRGALQQYAVREAGRWLEKAAGALKGNQTFLPVDELPGFLRDLTECRLYRGEHVLAQEAADELVAASRTAGSDRFLGQAHLLLGQIHWSQSRSHQAREEFERGLAAGAVAGDERAELLNACGVAASLGDGDEEAGERLLLEALATWKRSGNRLGQAKASVNLANLMVRRERLVEALEWYDRTLDLGRAIPDRMVVTINLTNRGMVQFWRGKYAEAERCLRESLELARELGLEQHAMQISEDLGRCRLAVADLREASGLFRAVATRAEAVGSAQAGWAALYLGRTYFAALETERAVEYWQICRRFLQDQPDPELEGELLLDEGRVARTRGDRTAAASRFREALEAAEMGQHVVLAAAARSFLWLGSAVKGGTAPPESESAFPDRLPLVALLTFQRGRALHACGQPAEALKAFALAAASTDSMGAARLGLHVHVAAVIAAREVGRVDRAKAHGDRADELVERLVERLPTDVPADRFRGRLSRLRSSG